MKTIKFIYVCISILLMFTILMFLSLITCENGELEDVYNLNTNYKIIRINETDATVELRGEQLYTALKETLNKESDILIYDNIDDIGLGIYDLTHTVENSYMLANNAFSENIMHSAQRYSYILKDSYLTNHKSLFKNETGTILGTFQKELPNKHYLVYNLFSYKQLQGNLIVKGSDELLASIIQELKVHHYTYTVESFSHWKQFVSITENPFFIYMLFSYVFVFIGLSYFIYLTFELNKKIILIKQALGASRKVIILENFQSILPLNILGCILAIVFHHLIVQQLSLFFIRDNIWIIVVAAIFTIIFIHTACLYILCKNLNKEGYLYE